VTCANCERLEREIVLIRDELILEKRLHSKLRERYAAREQECIRLRHDNARMRNTLNEIAAGHWEFRATPIEWAKDATKEAQ
jgi:hypothetical protein